MIKCVFLMKSEHLLPPVCLLLSLSYLHLLSCPQLSTPSHLQGPARQPRLSAQCGNNVVPLLGYSPLARLQSPAGLYFSIGPLRGNVLTIVMTDVSSNKIHSLRFPDCDSNAYLTFISFIIATTANLYTKNRWKNVSSRNRLEMGGNNACGMVVISTQNFYELEQAKNPSFGAFHHLNVEWFNGPNLSYFSIKMSILVDSPELRTNLNHSN